MAEEMRFNWDTPEEAKDVIKQLKLKKKELTAAKAIIAKQIAEVRAEHRSAVAQRGAKMQGGGGLGKFVRRLQTTTRDHERRTTDNAVKALEAKKSSIDGDIMRADQAILMVEKWLVENKPETPAPKAPRGKQPDVVDQLERLAKLRDAGVLTAEEFDAKKQELLSRL